MQNLEDMLCASLWARELEPSQLERVLSQMSERTVPAGGFAARKGEKVDAWLGVIDGLLKMSCVSADGRSATFTGLPNGAWFGEGTLMKNEARKYDLIALRDSRLAVMPRNTFHWLLDNSIAFNRYLLLQLNERLGQFIAMVEFDRLLDPDARIARCIAEMFNPILYPGNDMAIKISQEEIGYLSGVSRQRVNQALRELERAQLLRVEYGGLTILDIERLRRYEP
jgi:CRP-like cAMP-binding protein